jgi:hypothetical protein
MKTWKHFIVVVILVIFVPGFTLITCDDDTNSNSNSDEVTMGWIVVEDPILGTDNIGQNNEINSIAIGDKLVVGGYGGIAYSEDGKNWSLVTNSPTGISCIAYGNNSWVAVGGKSIAYSENGETWTSVNSEEILSPVFFKQNAMCNIHIVAYGNGKWVAGTYTPYGNMGYSEDNGKTWNAIESPFDDKSIGNIVYGNGKWVASSGSEVAYSQNGINWTKVTNFPDDILYGINKIVYSNGGWVAFSEKKMAYSENGETWTVVMDASFGRINDVAYGDGKWVAVGFCPSDDFIDSYSSIVYSENHCKTWNRAQGGYPDIIAYNNGKWVSAVNNGMAYSENGKTWTNVTDHPFTDTYEKIINIIEFNGRWIAISNYGRIAYSDYK